MCFFLFVDSCKLLSTCGVVSSLNETKATMDEFASSVVEMRRQHVGSDPLIR